MKTKKMIVISLFVCMSVAIYAIESMIPTLIPIPGVKPGLANIITLVSIYILGKKEAFLILMLRIALTTLLFGQVMSMWFSLAGGILSFVVMSCLSLFMDEDNIWAISVFGAFAHNVGQIAVAVIVTRQLAVTYYFLFLIISSIVTGVFTGICSKLCIKQAKRINILNIRHR
ncbi:MAG: Gx transporter family protein [Clostridia bacterium]|nr:Gx transporter family protein [Clostridia bacterium]